MNNQKIRIFLKYIISSILSTLGYSCYVLVDTIFLAMISDMAIAALNIVLPAYQLILAFGMMISAGASTIYAIKRGEGKQEEGSLFFNDALIIGVVVGLASTFILISFAEPILKALGANSETLVLAVDYLVGYMILGVFNIISMIVIAFIRCDGEPKLAGYASFIGSLSNVVLDVIFIFVFKWGMFGAAFATSLSPVIALIVCGKYFLSNKNGFHFVKAKVSINRLMQIAKLGLPAFISGVAGSFTMLVFNKQLLVLGGNLALTAYGIIVNLGVVVNCLNNGITQGVGPLLSDSFGRKNQQDLADYMKLTLGSIVVSFILSYSIVCLFPEILISIFNPENNIVLTELTKTGMIIYFSGSIFIGINHFLSTFFVSVNCPSPSSVIALLQTGLVITPIVILLPVMFGLNGVWLSYPISELMIMIVAIFLYIFNKKRIEL